jgi:Family of unknown function (DUF6221)
MDIAEFLTARLDEDEATAVAASRLQDDPENGWGAIPRPDVGSRGAATITPHIGLLYEAESVAHVVRWNPARVLADIAAKRKIVALCADMLWENENGPDIVAQETLRLLAAPHADHPDYDPTWSIDA